MTAADLLSHLESVRRSPRSLTWVARCPSHLDRGPSLSVKETGDRILLHCFAGCRTEEICDALGLTMRDLFFDRDDDPRRWREHRRRRDMERARRQQEQRFEGLTLDAEREARRFVDAAHDIDISDWPDTRLDATLNALADAYELMGDHHE